MSLDHLCAWACIVRGHFRYTYSGRKTACWAAADRMCRAWLSQIRYT